MCSTKSCEAQAEFRVFWPGSSPPPEFCEPCKDRAIGISQAMGFTLHVEPLTETPPSPSG